MRARGFRFRPPEVSYSGEDRWLLLRAFGPTERGLTEQIDGGVALERARALSLSARIAARTPRERLVEEAGEEAAAGFARDFQVAAALAIQLGQLARGVSSVAQVRAIQVVLLKHAAIEGVGGAHLGSREVGDLDVLVSKGRAKELCEALLRRGFVGEDFHPQDQHLPPLHHPSGALLEIHTAIPGVQVGGGRSWAEADDLLQHGLCAPAPDMPPGCFVPAREVLVAHLLVHAIEQHGLAPLSYPLLRTFGDLIDLGFGVDGLAAFMAGPYGWISRAVSRDEVRAVADLCDRLGAGDETLFGGGQASDDAGRVLAHVVAGTFDQEYQRSLRFQGMLRMLRHGPAGAFARELRRTLFLTRLQVDAIYGRPRSALGYIGRRLARPFDLVWRAARYGASGIRMRLRQRS